MKGTEIWQPFPEAPELYWISDHGDVKALSKKVDNGYVVRTTKEKMLKNSICKLGYSKHHLYIDGRKEYKTHRLVALAYIPNPENKPCVNHLDGNKLNNNINNLEWCTRSENSRHAYDTGLHNWVKYKHPTRK